MKIKLITILIVLTFYSTFLINQGCDQKTVPPIKTLDDQGAVNCPQPTSPFPSYDNKYGPPAWWCQENKTDPKKYPIFQINSDYPSDYESYIKMSSDSKQSCPECEWKKYNFRRIAEQEKYLKAVIDYIFKGNLENEWTVQNNAIGRKWFHAPFMHLDIVDPNVAPNIDTSNKKVEAKIEGKVAREFIHGLTMERTGCVNELNYSIENKPCDPEPKGNSTVDFQSWAVSFYNERGASYIGKVWEEMLHPKSGGAPNPQNFPHQGFPDGTVAVKLLFTQATPKDVPYLEGSPIWDADTANFIRDTPQKTQRMQEKCLVEHNCKNICENCATKMRLLQIDIAVRDDRAKHDEKSPTGWVFATFTYDNKAAPYIKYETEGTNYETPKEKDRINSWLRIKALGLMFGNDPGVSIGNEIKESLLDTSLEIPEHYGCGDQYNVFNRRLNGPVDNPKSSCISCHAQSETPQNLDIGNVPYGDMSCKDQSDINKWFINVDSRDPNRSTFTPSVKGSAISTLDYSLQLREGIRRYCIESYNNGENKCLLKQYKSGDSFTVITKEGTKTFTIQ